MFENEEIIRQRRGAPAPDSPLADVYQLAQLAGIASLRYRRIMLPAPGHPAPVSYGRPALYRKAEVLAWLQGKTAAAA
jgi:hypothetical protein